MLLRLLFPSWAFFDTVAEVPVLEARLGTGRGTGTWRSVLQAPARSRLAIVYNPEGTAHLALQGAVDRLAAECEQGMVDAVTRDHVAAIAESTVREWVDAGEPSATWAWRVVAITPRACSVAPRVLYESGDLPLRA